MPSVGLELHIFILDDPLVEKVEVNLLSPGNIPFRLLLCRQLVGKYFLVLLTFCVGVLPVPYQLQPLVLVGAGGVVVLDSDVGSRSG